MRVCRYLGKFDDEATPILFPSVWNRCFRNKDALTPNISHQEIHCLNDYHKCPLFLNSTQQKKIPVEKSGSIAKRKTWVIPVIALILIIIFAVLFMVSQQSLILVRGFIPQTGLTTSTSLAVGELSTPSPEIEPSPTLLPATKTITYPTIPLVTKTFTPIPKVELDTPFGSDVKFVIHRLQPGDNLVGLADRHLTSVEAILWVNYKLFVPLQVDRMIVIPVNHAIVDPDMPAFEPYEVVVYQIKVEDLALSLGVDGEALRFYNGIDSGQVLPFGYWLLVPRGRE